MNKVCSGFSTAVLALALCGGVLYGQSDNSYVTGTVKDATGSVVVDAKVTVRNEDNNFERQVSTNSSGLYIAPNLPPGYYTVIVEAPGFKRAERTRNKMDAGVPLTVSFELTVGQVTESVTVEASVATLQTETATVGKTVERAQIENMALNGRNPLFLAMLKPGVRSGGALAGFSFGLTSGGFAINGGRSQDSVITFDGAIGIRTRANGTSVGTADLETVQEVQVLTANYAAEYGRSGNGQIRMVTRSGNREFHGSLYEYFRNSALDANSWDRNRAGLPVAPFRFNQFGFVFSGPVFIPKGWNRDRNKLFWLFSQEYIRFRQEQTSIQTVPSMAMRQGDFSELLRANTFFNQPRAINDPLTGQPFPNNVIPASRLSPNGIAFLRTYPQPTPGFQQGTNNFIQVRPNPQNQRKDTVAVDYNMTQNQVIRARFANYSWTALDAFRSGFDFAITDWSRPNQTGSINHVWTISPTMINEFLVAASVDRVYIGIDRTGNRFSRSARGINYPYLFPEPKEIDDKIPTVQISNLATIDGGPYPAQSAGPIYNISNNFTKIAGNHQFKFGVLWERSGQNDFDQINVTGVPGGTNNQNGRFVFDDIRAGAATSGVAMGNAALGLFSTYAEIGPRSYTPYRGHMFEYFAQDSWRVNERLKLELGFRGTWMNGYYKSLWGNMAVFRPELYDPARAAVLDRATGNVISGDRFNGVFIPGTSFPDAGRGRVPAIDSGQFDRLLRGSPYPSDNQHNIVPRVGLAYQASSRDVIRAGFGGFISRPGVYDSVFLGGNPPFQPMGSVANGVADNPGGATRVQFPQFFMTIDPVYKIPRGYNWNLSYQRNLGFETTIEVAYIGSTGNYLAMERDLNQLPLGTTFRPENAGANVNFLRPFKGFSFIPMLEHSARSEYNALQIEANRRFSRGLSYGFAYTYSTAYDHASGPRDRFYNSYDGSNMWGRSGFDTRHVAIANFIWELPFLKDGAGFVRTAFGGWQITGVAQFQTGTPFTIGESADFYGIGSGDFKPWNITTTTPPNPKQFSAGGGGANDPTFWFDPRPGGTPLASRPANGTMGNQNRNSITIHQPGFQNWNLAVFKNFRFAERHNVQFRAESFNWINHPNLGGANGGGLNTNPLSANFGQVVSKGGQRQWQLALRYSF
jgi:hypothetical protein